MKIFGAMLALVAVVSCTSTTKLRIVQYNVGVFSKELDNSIPMIADMMKELGADVISLNELDSCNLRHANYQIQDFAEEMGAWNFKYSYALKHYKEGSYGVGVCIKEEIVDSYEIHFDKYDGSETRACCVVETEKYVLASTHLEYKGEIAQLEQAKVLNEEMVRRYKDCKKPVFLCGDMNAYPDSETVAELKKEWTLLSGTEYTISAKRPHACIDYVFLLNNGAKCKVTNYEVPVEFACGGDVTVASDHLPVLVDVEF